MNNWSYAATGCIAALIEEWASYEGTEYGDMLTAGTYYIDRLNSLEQSGRAGTVVSWLLDDLDALVSDPMFFDIKEYWPAQDQYESITTDWRETAKGLGGEHSADLELHLAALPDYFQPGDRPVEPEVDPEMLEYLRLKKKFDN